MHNCFSFFQFTYSHLYVYIIWRFNVRFCSLYAYCPLVSIVTVRSICSWQRCSRYTVGSAAHDIQLAALLTIYSWQRCSRYTVGSAAHDIQSTLQEFLFVVYCVTSFISNRYCLWSASFSYTIHFLISFLCFIFIISNFQR